MYPITDVRLTGLTHAEQVARLIGGGATWIQLREKHLSPHDFFQQAERAIAVARAKGVRIVINDRVDIALALSADGVHLGQDDMPPAAARALLGDQAIIGFSTHSLLQALSARDLPIDYMAVGPIFRTSSKGSPDPTIGLAGLKELRGAIGECPLVAIGGITAADVKNVLEAGASCVAVISAVLADPARITAATEQLIAASR
jgi:thiamine-phosphate pyrophosphorylase